MRLSRNAAILAAVLGAMGSIQSAPALTGHGIAASQNTGKDKQAPIATSRAPIGLQFLADAGAGFSRAQTWGCPWPGRTAARSRRRAGAYWSGR